eukprot:CAMPEP_0119154356 /NCGR_PEP_ID=MMETSP1310-20130426/50683_1 /TAXON_ID=464262 /ORGANISM="Genus nov. species nov., Strain RCC2339" /LENGTH=226 /DNA_ID=CAMNT_0007146885 /DNA_START=96 /DNA_END=773 /DNA_ORIENTATION=-
MANEFEKTKRNTVKRVPERGHYDFETVHQVLDKADITCTVSWASEGKVRSIPTLYARDGNSICIHGSVASRMLKELTSGAEACVVVTSVQGVVLARSIFHHSANYKSAVCYGSFKEVQDAEEKLRLMHLISERLVPGRWDHVRPPNSSELRTTSILTMDIDTASAKIREGPPGDDKQDLDQYSDVWAGVITVRQEAGGGPSSRLVPDDLCVKNQVAVPEHVAAFRL